MTLIELMVTLGLSMVIISAAISVFVTLSQQLRRGERVVEAQQQSAVALTVMQQDLANAGWRFPSGAFAFRHYNNLAVGAELRSGPVVNTAGGCGANGLLVNTDVVEFASGLIPDGAGVPNGGTQPPPGRVTSVTLGDPVIVNLANTSLLGPLPFLAGEAGNPPLPPALTALSDVILFSAGNGNACLGRTVDVTLGGVLTVRMLDADYELAPPGYYANCPAPNMRAYRLGTRVRYMVCGPTANAQAMNRTLFRQLSTDGTGTFGLPEAVQDGVEDLQVAVRYLNRMAWAGSGCVGGATPYCFCNDALSGACDGLAPITPPVNLANHPRQLVRGARVALTAVGQRMANDPQESSAALVEYRRPGVFDRGPEAAGDGFLRVQQQFGLSFLNLMVVP